MHRQQTEETENSINQSAPCYSVAGSAPAMSARAGPVMASCLNYSGPRPAVHQSPCPSRKSTRVGQNLSGRWDPPSQPPLCILTPPGGCGPPPAGPPFPRPLSRMTGSFPGYHIRNSLPACTMGGHFSHPFSQSSTAPATASSMIHERIQAASPSWTHPQGCVEPPLLAIWSGSPSLLNWQSATGLRELSPVRRPVPHLPGPRRIQRWTPLATLPPGLKLSSSTLRPPGLGSTRLHLRSCLRRGRYFPGPLLMSAIGWHLLAQAVSIASGSSFNTKVLFLCVLSCYFCYKIFGLLFVMKKFYALFCLTYALIFLLGILDYFLFSYNLGGGVV